MENKNLFEPPLGSKCPVCDKVCHPKDDIYVCGVCNNKYQVSKKKLNLFFEKKFKFFFKKNKKFLLNCFFFFFNVCDVGFAS